SVPGEGGTGDRYRRAGHCPLRDAVDQARHRCHRAAVSPRALVSPERAAGDGRTDLECVGTAAEDVLRLGAAIQDGSSVATERDVVLEPRSGDLEVAIHVRDQRPATEGEVDAPGRSAEERIVGGGVAQRPVVDEVAVGHGGTEFGEYMCRAEEGP